MATNNTRNAFFGRIASLMENNNDIYIVSVDLAGPPFDDIRRKYPDRYVSVGIAEQNAVAVACGLASLKKKVIVYAANPFPLLRAFDQIRNCACAMKLPVAVVGLGTGFSVAECGTTHLTIEDVALASLCAGMDIYSVSDTDMAIGLANAFTRFEKPTYIRLGKWSDAPLCEFDEKSLDFGFRVIKEGVDAAVVATGCTVKLINDMNIPLDFALIDFIKLSCPDHLIEHLKKYSKIITVEEQQLRGGIGSLILEKFNNMNIMKHVERIGIDLTDGYPQEYGDRDYWLSKYGITMERITGSLK